MKLLLVENNLSVIQCKQCNHSKVNLECLIYNLVYLEGFQFWNSEGI